MLCGHLWSHVLFVWGCHWLCCGICADSSLFCRIIFFKGKKQRGETSLVDSANEAFTISFGTGAIWLVLPYGHLISVSIHLSQLLLHTHRWGHIRLMGIKERDELHLAIWLKINWKDVFFPANTDMKFNEDTDLYTQSQFSPPAALCSAVDAFSSTPANHLLPWCQAANPVAAVKR